MSELYHFLPSEYSLVVVACMVIDYPGLLRLVR